METEGATIDIHGLLEKHFGWSEFKLGQEAVIGRLLDGRSVLSVFPTGGGKSLCYQLPALELSGLTVVVSPLIALMKDQIDQLTSKGISAVRLDSSLSLDEYRQTMESIRSGEAKLLYVAPERFFNERFRSSLEDVDISLFAIDEAHCISQWGHNFRPDYLKLALIAEQLNVGRVLCLTATATPAVQEDICNAFQIDSDDVIATDFFRPNLHIQSEMVTTGNQSESLLSHLTSQDGGATIVYVTQQKTAESVADKCVKAGLNAKAYHAGMDSDVRHEIQEWFMTGDDRIVVATIAFGMGIDKADIRYVYHYNPPKSIENYAQEIGRAGRDGETSKCVMLFNPRDMTTLENFVYGDTPTRGAVYKFLSNIDRQPDEFFVSQYKLSRESDIKSIVIKTLLTYLELDGFIAATAARYDSYSFKPLVPSAEILSKFKGERKEFVSQLLSCCRKSKVWVYLDVPEAMAKIGCDRSRIVKAVDYFGEQGWIDLRVSGLMHGFRRLKPFSSVDTVCDEIVSRLTSREASEIERVGQVVELARAVSCQAGMLSEHFGQPLEKPCGTCTACESQSPLSVPAGDAVSLPTGAMETISQLRSEHTELLSSSRTVTRFLCGLTSPGLTAAKLSRHEKFGCCRDVPFADVLREVEAS